MPGIQAGNTDELIHGNIASVSGTYTDASLTIGTDGRVTAASSGIVSPAVFVGTATTTISNTVNETTIVPTGTGSMSYTPVAGAIVILEIGAVVSSTGTPNMTLKVYKGSTVLLTGNPTGNGKTKSSLYWRVQFVVRSTTTMIGTSLVQFPNKQTGFTTGATAVTVSSAAETIDVKVTWGTASTLNKWVTTNLLMQTY